MKSASERSYLPFFILSLIGYSIYVIMDAICKKLIGTYHVSQIVFINSLFALVPISLFVTYKKGWKQIKKFNLKVQIARGLCNFLAMTIFFISSHYLSLISLYSIVFIAPLLLTMGANFFLGEKVGWRRYTAVIVGFIGVVVSINPLGETYDVVLLTSKAYDARWLAEFIRPYLADDGLLVAVQNGMTATSIGEVVGERRTLGCVVELASQMFEPGEVTRNTVKRGTWFGVGAYDQAQIAHIGACAEILGHAGTVEVADDILSAKWMKLTVNAMTMGLKAILGTTNEEVFKIDGAREMFLRAGEEALAAGQLLGYTVVPIFGLRPADVANTNSLLETLLEKIVHDVGPKAINTVQQDHMKGRYSEIDMINGLVAETNRLHGREAAVNRAIVDITRRIHAGELKPSPSNFILVRKQLN